VIAAYGGARGHAYARRAAVDGPTMVGCRFPAVAIVVKTRPAIGAGTNKGTI